MWLNIKIEENGRLVSEMYERIKNMADARRRVKQVTGNPDVLRKYKFHNNSLSVNDVNVSYYFKVDY